MVFCNEYPASEFPRRRSSCDVQDRHRRTPCLNNLPLVVTSGNVGTTYVARALAFTSGYRYPLVMWSEAVVGVSATPRDLGTGESTFKRLEVFTTQLP